MTRNTHDARPLDAAHAAFIQGRVSVNLAARGADQAPVVARGAGCRVSPEGDRVAVFVSASRAADLLEGIRAHGAVAVVCSRPSTHDTLQLKGVDAAVVPLGEGDEARVAALREAFTGELTGLGYPEDFARAITASGGDDWVVVVFTPAEVYSQTPGPDAGRCLSGAG